MKSVKLLICFPVLMLAMGCQTSQTPEPEKSKPSADEKDAGSGETKPIFMAHYMPWYQTPEVNSAWGWHWTMDYFDPDIIDAHGYPQIASHFMPLTGPYDSQDPDVLEYQVLLMKMSGIDGVIVDWYGSTSSLDYGIINQSTAKLFEATKKAGLLFSICYEDQTIKHLAERNLIDTEDVYSQGQEDMAYLENTWFQEETYLKTPSGPVLLNFGPQYFVNGSDWEVLFEKLDRRPVFVTLDKHYVPAAVSSFPWPPMWASKDGILTQADLESYLDGYYQKAKSYSYKVAGAFPGFHDIYQEAGVGQSYGFLDAQEGAIFEVTLQKAVEQEPDVIQFITWNDYGEGTVIEPTVEFGYRYLEMIQTAKYEMTGSGVKYSNEDLRLPLTLFQLRKKYGDETTQARLDEAFNALVSGEVNQAAEILASIP